MQLFQHLLSSEQRYQNVINQKKGNELIPKFKLKLKKKKNEDTFAKEQDIQVESTGLGTDCQGFRYYTFL